MPPPRKKMKMTETKRFVNGSVSFEQFKKLIENLSDICFEVQRDGVAGEGSKTLDECARWYYESFYSDPEVRKKYPCKLRACPMNIREKLLRMPESEREAEPAAVDGHQISEGVLVKVAKNGTFIFPVTFFAFKSCIDAEQVLRVMGKTPEQRRKLLADEKIWNAILKRFYNMYYMFPDRPAAHFFRNVSLLLLSQLLKPGRPNDEIARRSVAKHAAEKKRPPIVNFATFELNLSNMYDIVWQLKLHDRNYVALDFEKCAQALYLAFYLKLEIRDKYTFKWRPCTSAMSKRLLAVPTEQEAAELRRSMPHLETHALAMQLKEVEEIIEIFDSQPEEPTPAADTPENITNSLNASEPTLITIKGVAYEYPVTCSCFLQFVNFDEVLPQIRATKRAGIQGLSDMDLMQGLYLSFYTNEEIRKQFKFRFKPAPPALRERLLAMAKPVSQQESQEVVNQPENQEGSVTHDRDTPPNEGKPHGEEIPRLFLEDSSQGSEEEPFETDVEVNVGTPGRFLYPVSFDTFRRCINYAEIILPVLMLAVQDKSQLAGLVAHPRNPLCEKIFRRYYRSFYIFRDARERYPYRFTCPDSLVLKKLTEYAKPLDENAIKTLEEAKTRCEDETDKVKAKADTVLVQESQSLSHLDTEKLKKNQNRESNDQVHKENREKARNSPPLPVTFHVFKRYVKNFVEILQKMQLCKEYKDKSEFERAEEYYKGFYTSPEMRQKFECKFRPCPVKMRDLLLSYAQKPQLAASSQESEVDVEFVPEVCLDKCNNIVEKGSREAVPVEESKEAAHEGASSQESDCDVEFVPEAASCLDNIVEKGRKEVPTLPTRVEESKEAAHEGASQESDCDVEFVAEAASCLDNIVGKGRKEVPTLPTRVGESKEAADKGASSQESEVDVEFVPEAAPCLDNCNNVVVTKSKEATTLPVREVINVTDKEEERPKEKSVNPVSFQLFQRYISNLKEIVSQMLLCDEHKGKSEEDCARDYYIGFYSSQERRDMFPYQLKPCPAQMRNKLLSFPKKKEDNSPEKQSEQCAPASGSEEIIIITESEDVEMPPSEIPVQTEETSAQNQSSNHTQQTAAALHEKSRENPSNAGKRKHIRTFKNGASFEFPVSYETFKRHINYKEIIQSLLKANSNNESEQPADRGKRLFRQFFSSFYVQKEVRQSHPYRFQSADAELLQKLEEYAVPLNEVAKLTMSSQAPESEVQPWTVPRVPKDDTVVTLAGITYRFPVSFRTFQQYINYEELKVGLANGPGPKKKSPGELADILADETSCLRLLRRYYYSFYTVKGIRNKLKYNFKAAPTELVEKLLEFAKPVEASEPQLEPQGVPNVPVKDTLDHVQPPVTLSVFLKFMKLEDVVRGMQQESEYSKLSEVQCKIRYYEDFYSNSSIRDRYPYKLRPCPAKVRDRILMLPPQAVELKDSTNPPVTQDLEELYASREAELAGKQRTNVVRYRPSNLRQYIDRHIAMPEKQALLERHILDSRKAKNATINRAEESPESRVSKVTDPVAEVGTSAAPAKVIEEIPKESKSVKSSELASASNEKSASSSCSRKDVAEKSQAEASREPSKPGPARALENTQNNPKSSADMPGPSTSSSTLRVTEKKEDKRKESETKKCLELEERTKSTSKKNKEANSTKESKAQTNLVQVSETKETSRTTSKKNDGEEARNKPPAEANRKESLPDSAKTLESNRNHGKDSKTSTSIRTLKVTEKNKDKTKENESKKCPELAERLSPTSKKNREATATKESPTKKVTEGHSRKESEAQKSSEQVSVKKGTSSTTSKKIDGRKVTDSAKTLESNRNHAKDSSDIPGNSAPAVTQKVTGANSTKETESQKNSEQLSVTKETSSTTSKKKDGEKATNKPQLEASKTDNLPDSANITKSKPNNPKTSPDIQEAATSSSTQNPEKSQDKREASSKEGTGTNSGASSTSAPSPKTLKRQTERQIILEQAEAVFFAESTQDHNMTYLICTSQGLKQAVWRILYQLTFEEFKTYTSIHNGEDLYRSDEDLQPYYQHVVEKGNWPINLYIRLPMLRQLLHSKGVQLDQLDLRQLSPKMLHWRELDEHTDFDKIVEMQFTERTGEEIDSVEQWFEEREQFYAACWRHDQWVYEVPQITNESLQDETLDRDLPLPDLEGIVLKPLHIVESCDPNSQTDIFSLTSSSDMVPDSQSCPPTQLSTPNFVDIASVDMQSQVPEAPLDPLASQPEQLTSVKQEPIKFLNNLRGICNTDGCHWETITSQEQIVDLDASQEGAPSLSCFAIPKRSERISPNQSLDALLTASMFEDEEEVIVEETPPGENASKESIEHTVLEDPESEESDVKPAVPPMTNEIQPQIPLPNPATRKKKLPASNPVPSKRARLGNEKVPQLRHEFRPLPLNACVRIETDILGTDDPPTEAPLNTPIPQPELPSTEAQPEVPVTLTPSQDFALGNTIFESSQLAALLDALPGGTNVRKVNEKEPVNENRVRVTAPTPPVIPSPRLRTNVIFRKLEYFRFFNPLTMQHVNRYMIEGPLQGATYKSALLKVDGRVCQVRGPLLETLFPHLSPLLRSDLSRVLHDLPEFVYNCRWRRVLRDNTEDLRKRVLYAFMDMATEFGQFRLQFDDQQWVTCIEIGRWDWEVPEKRPRCSNVAEKVIRPGILEKMREFKELMS